MAWPDEVSQRKSWKESSGHPESALDDITKKAKKNVRVVSNQDKGYDHMTLKL